jgi:hypothetical protein
VGRSFRWPGVWVIIDQLVIHGFVDIKQIGERSCVHVSDIGELVNIERWLDIDFVGVVRANWAAYRIVGLSVEHGVNIIGNDFCHRTRRCGEHRWSEHRLVFEVGPVQRHIKTGKPSFANAFSGNASQRSDVRLGQDDFAEVNTIPARSPVESFSFRSCG